MVTWTTTSSLPDNQPRAEPTGSPQLAVAPQPSCTNVPWDVGGLQGSNWNPTATLRRGPSLPQSRSPPVPTRSAHARTPTYPLRLHKILLDPHRKVEGPGRRTWRAKGETDVLPGGRRQRHGARAAGSGEEQEGGAARVHRPRAQGGRHGARRRRRRGAARPRGRRRPRGAGEEPLPILRPLHARQDAGLPQLLHPALQTWISELPSFPFSFFWGACPLGLFWLAAEAAGCKVGWAIRALIEQFLDL
jgi:hypothetical protein